MKKNNSLSLSLVSFIIILWLIINGVRFVSEKSLVENAIALEKNIQQAAVTCYSIEGSYPQSIEYLEKNYGLIVDRERYVIQYETVGSNLMPSIAATPKGTYYFEQNWSKK